MRKIFTALMCFAIALFMAQTIEEEVSNKSCECISLKLSQNTKISQSEIQKCISKSGDEVLKSKSPSEIKKITGNREQFVEKLKMVYKIISANCLNKESERQ